MLEQLPMELDHVEHAKWQRAERGNLIRDMETIKETKTKEMLSQKDRREKKEKKPLKEAGSALKNP